MRDFFLLAVFLWSTPLLAALSRSLKLRAIASLAASLSPATTAASNFLICVRTLLLIIRLCILRFTFWRSLFSADLLATLFLQVYMSRCILFLRQHKTAIIKTNTKHNFGQYMILQYFILFCFIKKRISHLPILGLHTNADFHHCNKPHQMVHKALFHQLLEAKYVLIEYLLH